MTSTSDNEFSWTWKNWQFCSYSDDDWDTEDESFLEILQDWFFSLMKHLLMWCFRSLLFFSTLLQYLQTGCIFLINYSLRQQQRFNKQELCSAFIMWLRESAFARSNRVLYELSSLFNVQIIRFINLKDNSDIT